MIREAVTPSRLAHLAGWGNSAGVFTRRGNFAMSKSKRGFGSMSPERQKEIASMGGRSVRPEQRSFSQDRELAKSAGRKGGSNTAPEKRSFSRDRELAVSAGSKGGRNVAPEDRSFSRDPELAVRAGSLGGSAK